MNLENEAAQVEAEKCGVIAKDVTELQARCEKDLAAAEPLVAQAEAALDTLNKKDLGMPLFFVVQCSHYMQFSFQCVLYEKTTVAGLSCKIVTASFQPPSICWLPSSAGLSCR